MNLTQSWKKLFAKRKRMRREGRSLPQERRRCSQEFYASYGATQKHKKSTGPLNLRACLEKVKVRGVEVDYSTKAINRAYFDDDDADATDYLAKMENPGNHYTWIASLITTDEMNPKMKKRKREPTVAHVSETELGIGSQVEHTQAADAQPLTSDTPSATQSTQYTSATRCSSSSLRPNSRLGDRISKLEGIDVREALAALKTDMSRVKTDFQQLQPDLSIFDAPLPKDEVFEDERVDTDEEELEDDHVTKELDQERQVKIVVQRSMDDVTT
ncbi:hypothetical protein HAX54_036630 [Datura stramonium]|uniref:Uncharacterized protein n=1 Tax=Datura stramonium TaxID=4076 RepID=A0ABS8SGB3_DATST|nr:hypothetical protein [Datura stramonium]